jgi:hypothetical protein
MFVLGFVLVGLGGYAFVLGGTWLLVKAFKQSAVWGLLSLLIPLAYVVFGLKYWGQAGRPLMIHAAGVFAFIGGVVLLSMNFVAIAQDAAGDSLVLEPNGATAPALVQPAVPTGQPAPVAK